MKYVSIVVYAHGATAHTLTQPPASLLQTKLISASSFPAETKEP